MKRMNISKVCYAISVLLMLGFIIHTIVDYRRYNSTLNSAPFYIWVVVNMVSFVVPAIIAWIIGLVIKRKTTDG